MKLRIVHTPRAELDLSTIYLYLLEQSGSIEVADRILYKTISQIEFLAEFPGLGSIRTDFVGDKPIRFFPVDSHYIVYRFSDEVLTVLRILHGAQDSPDTSKTNKGQNLQPSPGP